MPAFSFRKALLVVWVGCAVEWAHVADMCGSGGTWDW